VDHLSKIEAVLAILDNAGFKADLRKSFFMQQELEYFFWIPSGVGRIQIATEEDRGAVSIETT